MRLASRTNTVCLVFLGMLLIACGGGGGSTTPGGDPGPDPGPGPTPGPTGYPLALDYSQGDWFDFVWTTEYSSFAQPDDYDSEVGSGQFRMTLGAPTTISGSQAFPLQFSGDVGDFRPRWTHLAVGADGSLRGSIGGSSLRTVYSPASTTWTGGGFFVRFGDTESVRAANGQFDGNYNHLTALVVSHSASEGGCESILGEIICSEESTSFSEREHFKQGVGPIGYAMRSSWTSNSGGFFTSFEDRWTVELIATSETPADGSQFKPPPWEVLSDMPQARSDLAAAAYEGEIYVIGGQTSSSSLPLRSVLIYNPSSDSWRYGSYDTPDDLYSPTAVTLGNRIYVISRHAGSDFVFALDPASGWTQRAAALFDDPSFATCAYDHPTLGDLALVMSPNGAFSGSLQLFAYRPADDTWYFGDTPLSSIDHRWFATSMLGDTLYLSGGWRQSASNKLFDRALRQDMVNEEWLSTTSAMNEGRYDHASGVLDGRLYVMGGRPGPSGPTHRSVESYDPGLDMWVEEVPMFGARRNFAVVELGGWLYAIGGHDGNAPLATVERYAPQD